MTISLRYTAMSDVGLVRRSNQDAGYASNNLLVLADGMGGAAGGDIASSVVVAHLAAIDDVHQAEDLLPLLTTTLEDAHAELIERSEEKKELAGLGTTCTAILRASNKLGMVHIGDSRAYLLRKGKLTQVTRDHTLVQYLLDQGDITKEEAENHPKRNVIMRNIGDTPESLDIDGSVREAVPGDRWLLTSDGLFGVVSDESIEKTLNEYDNLDECAQKLVDLALSAGAPDNVTVVLADVVEKDPAPISTPIVVGSAAVDSRKPTRGGSSAAGKLAVLRRRTTADEEMTDETVTDDDAAPRTPTWARIAATLALLALLIGGGTGAYAWTQTQYYVAPADGNIAIYKGVPTSVGPLKFSKLYERSDVEIDGLTPVAQDRLKDPITRGSYEEARKALEDLALHERIEPEPKDAPSKEPSPSVYPPTQPSPSPTPSRGTSVNDQGTPTPLPTAVPRDAGDRP